MKFGPVAPGDALGATAVHSIRQGDLVLKKGTLIGPAEVAALTAAGVKEIVVARLEAGDVSEDRAAADIAHAVKGEGVRADRAFTGRCNLFAETSGVLVLAKDAVDRLNRIDEAVTFATLPAFKPVVEGEMVATVKIIPFAVAASARDQAVAEAATAKPVIRVAPYKVRKIGIVSTLLPGLSPKVVEKTLKITATRLQPAGATIVAEKRVPHETPALARAIDEVLKASAELVIVFGASAIADRRDVIPAAVEAVGGEIEHFGMPVDPGNLMLIGRLRGQAVIGAPGCARSPKENGFDWVLMRLLAGLPVSRADITGMGVGGLLMEIVTRPQPRTEPAPEKGRNIAALVLAAGRSTRMGAINKLIAEIGGKPLVRIAAEQALASRAKPVIVVTGHRARARGSGARRIAGAFRAQRRLCRRSRHLAEGRHCRGAGGRRRRHCLPRRHAAGRRRADRQIGRGLRSGTRRAGGGAHVRRKARQSGGMVAAVFPRPHVDPRRHRRPPPDRQLRRGGRRSPGRRRSRAHGRRHARVVFLRQGRNRARLRRRIIDRRCDSPPI